MLNIHIDHDKSKVILSLLQSSLQVVSHEGVISKFKVFGQNENNASQKKTKNSEFMLLTIETAWKRLKHMARTPRVET